MNNTEPTHTLTGKIARLPKSVREKLNRRLDNGAPASEILPWLNSLYSVKKVLTAWFAGAPINDQNLTNWRGTGYQRWLQNQAPIAGILERAEYASDAARAGRGRLANGVATVAVTHLLSHLDTIPPEKRSTADLAKIAHAVTALVHAEQNNLRLKFDKKRLRLKDEQVTLAWDKHLRDTAAIALRVLDDDQAKAVKKAPIDNSAKIELIGQRLFGKLWRARNVTKVRTSGDGRNPTNNE
jgi:hypothetical protein